MNFALFKQTTLALEHWEGSLLPDLGHVGSYTSVISHASAVTSSANLHASFLSEENVLEIEQYGFFE